MSNGIDYDALKRSREGRGGYSRVGWKARNGSNRVRVLPPTAACLDDWGAMRNLATHFRMHFFRMEGRPTEVTRCLDDLKERCPSCAQWRMHRESASPELKEMAGNIRPADQYLFNIIDLENIQGGIQPWSANWTSWDKIMEIAANAAWGNVVDPADGVNFVVTLTPGSETKTGRNVWSVMPEPTRTSVMPILETLTDWRDQLDALTDNIVEPKAADEISEILEEMGFPPLPDRRVSGTAHAGSAVAAAPTPVPAVPAPAMVGTSAPGPVAPTPISPAPAAVPAPAPTPAAPTPAPAVAATPAVAAAPTPVPAVPAPAMGATSAPGSPAVQATGPAPGVHYDPGPDYVEKVPVEARPARAPRCFSDYDQARHQCPTCPVVVECQLKMLEGG